MGSIIHHCGAPGTGIRTKLINNFLAVSQNQLSAEAMTLATAFGLDLEQTLKVVTGTTATNGANARVAEQGVLRRYRAGLQDRPCAEGHEPRDGIGASVELPLMTGATVKECLTVASRGLGFGDKDFSGLRRPAQDGRDRPAAP